MDEAVPLDELEHMDSDFICYLDQSESVLTHFVFELDESIELPALRNMANLKFPTDKRTGWLIVIGDINPVAKFLLVMTSKLNRTRFNMISTIDEAMQFLQKVDSTLPQHNNM